MKRAYVWITGLALALSLTACGGSYEEDGSVPDTEVHDEQIVGTIPDKGVIRYTVSGYDVDVFCDGSTRVYLKYNAIAVSTNDPACTGGGS